MGFLKNLGLLNMFTAKTPGDLAVGAYLYKKGEEKEKSKNQLQVQEKEEIREISFTTCRNCGCTVNEDDDFCKNCGIEFTKDEIHYKKEWEASLYNNGTLVDLNNYKYYHLKQYRVGEDIPTGEYLYFCPKGNGAYMVSTEKKNSDFELPSDDAFGCMSKFFRFDKKGIYLTINDGYLINTNELGKISYENITGGFSYRIGKDIDPGTYDISLKEGSISADCVIYRCPEPMIGADFYESMQNTIQKIYIKGIESVDMLDKTYLEIKHGICNITKNNSDKGKTSMSINEVNEFFKGQTINFEIIEVKNDVYTDGSKGISLYFKVLNQTSRSMKIGFDSISIVKKDREEKDFDSWLDGYNLYSVNIGAGNFKKGAVVFQNITTSSISQFNVFINDISNNKNYNLLFSYKDGNWEFNVGEVLDLDNLKKDSKIAEKKIKENIERIEPFEDELGIVLENISINISDDFDKLSVLGEIVSSNQEKNKKRFYIYVNYYNKENEIVNKDSLRIDDFKGYDSFEFINWKSSLNIREVEKIRIFVKED